MERKKFYSKVDQRYITKKIPDIPWTQISESLRQFWIDWRDKHQSK